VERVSRKAARTGSGRVELGWQRPPAQMSGRTGGDLITVFPLPEGRRPQDLVGRIVSVKVTGSGPLILYGRLEHGLETRSVSEHARDRRRRQNRSTIVELSQGR
jgi:hypothetical protein